LKLNWLLLYSGYLSREILREFANGRTEATEKGELC